MLSWKLIFVLLLGTALMLIPMVIMAGWYKIKVWKMAPASLLLTVAGTIGTYIWYFIENYGIGRSFYGAVFLVPVFFLVVPKILRIPYGDLLDLCAPAECVMLALMKIQCLVDGCCAGIVLFTTSNNVPVHFPSQMIEMANAIVVFAILILLAKKQKARGTLYPWYLVIYGSSRFILNFFRARATPLFLGLSVGSIWSLCAIAIGCIALHSFKRKRNR